VTRADTQVADRGLKTHIPIWVRVPGIIALVLVGVVVGAMWLGGDSRMGDHGDGGRTAGTDHNGGGDMEGMDHDGDDQTTENPAQVVTVTMVDNAFQPVEIEVQRGTLVRLEFENTGTLLHDFTIDAIPIEDLRTEGGLTSGDRADQEPDRAAYLALDPGASGAMVFRATVLGEYEFYCDQPGHRGDGMVGMIRVDIPPDNSDHGRSGDGDGH
jgi:uncharacterized cupredoxin-like copper-binding protein